jgi:hypothetical protein
MRKHRPPKIRKKNIPKSSRELGAHTFRKGLRHGLYLDSLKRAQIVRQIQSKNAEFVEQWSINRTIWRVTVQNKSVCVVYDKRFNELATVLHPDDARNHEKKERETTC